MGKAKTDKERNWVYILIGEKFQTPSDMYLPGLSSVRYCILAC